MSLQEYLENKPLFYQKIDYERMPRAYESLKTYIKLKPVVHIVGTNGKGSTGRFLTQICESLGCSVGHYTSPHIFKFNERFYKNGNIVSDDELELAHQKLQSLLSDEFKNTLSYFEYATFLAAFLFEECDYVVFESGMGAEFDATNHFSKALSLFTPIGLDHIGSLGVNLEEISRTKLISMDKFAILNSSMNEISIKIAKEIASKKGTNLKLASEVLDDSDELQILEYAKKFNLPKFQISNLSLAFAGAKTLSLKPNLANLKPLNLKGRLERVKPNLVVDVGHNELAAQNIANELSGQKFSLVYNSFLDKDYKKVIEVLKPLLNEVQIYEYESEFRELATNEIKKVCESLIIKCSKFKSLEESRNYLVFGSFMLVEEFLKNENLC